MSAAAAARAARNSSSPYPLAGASRRRAGALAGIVAGPLFLLVVVLLTWREYDYLRSLGWTVLDSGDVPWPSGLALSGLGWAQVANFAVAGLLLLFFTRTVRAELPDRRSARVASGLMTLISAAIVASAAPTDRDFGAAPTTWHGWTHGLAFLTIVLGSVVTPLVTAWSLRGVPRWAPMARVSVAVAVVCAGSLFVPSQLGFYVFLVTLFGWFAALAVRFLRPPA